MSMRKVLMITYLFPPCGGSGVQRNLKYVKYMPEYNWKPYVLTSKNITYHVYDYSLLAEIPKEAVIIRSNSVDPYRLAALFRPSDLQINSFNDRINTNITNTTLMYYRRLRDLFAFPDALVGWIPFAINSGLKVIRKYKIDIILGAGSCTEAIIAKLLSLKANIPYVLDFRDGWIDNPYLPKPTPIHLYGHRILERYALINAAKICVYGDYLQGTFQLRYPSLANRIEIITNGFDPADCTNVIPAESSNRLHRIVYSGSLYERYLPIFDSLLVALRSLPESLLSSLEVLFVGRVEIPNAEAKVANAKLQNHIKFTGYVSHHEALSYLLSADSSLLILPVGDVQAYSGKVFEYLMAKNPIIACVEPQGTCADLLRNAGQGNWIVSPGDSRKLSEVIANLASSGWPRIQTDQIELYNRKFLTKHLCTLLLEAINNTNKPVLASS